MQPHVLRTPDAARYVGLAESTLEKMRIYGTGPVYQKAGAKIIVYRREDLDLWLENGRRKSTSNPDQRECLWSARCRARPKSPQRRPCDEHRSRIFQHSRLQC